MKLSEQHCEACRSDAPQVSAEEQDALLMELPDWQVIHEDDVPQLMRVYAFRDFLGYTDLMVDGAPSPHQSDTTLRWLIDRLRS